MNCKAVDDGFETVLSVYPNSKGYAYALMKGPLTVIEKRMISISPVENTRIIKEIKELVNNLVPQVLVLENPKCKYSRKSPRSNQLLRSLSLIAKNKNIMVYSYSREDIRLVFEIWKAKTKFEIAEVIAKNIKSFRMLIYEKPKYPDTQKYITALFDAVSLGITHYYKTT